MGTRVLLLRGSWTSLPREGLTALAAPVIATLGNFDGVHLGHQGILAKLREKRDLLGAGTLLLISFYPHPIEVLRPQSPQVRILTPLRQKVELLAAQGINIFSLLHFTPGLARISASEFIQKVLIENLKIDYLFVGPDARVGADRLGTPEFISKEFARRNRHVVLVPFYSENGKKISSGEIRGKVEAGDVHGAAELLGRPYALDGLVVHGDHRGSTIGVPTANLAPSVQVLPALGVYASWAELGTGRYPAVTNVGVRPTFGGCRVVVETHLMHYDKPDFYGERLKVHLVQRLRAEMKFSGIAGLVDQIRLDMESARCVLERDQ